MEDIITSYKIEEAVNEELLNHINDTLMCAQNNQSSLYETIETTLMELLKEEAQRDGTNPNEVSVTHEDTQKLVDFIAESMRNHIHKVNGNENRYRFSPYLMGLAMNQYIQSGTSGYDQMRADNVIIMPSSGNLARKKQAQKILSVTALLCMKSSFFFMILWKKLVS